MERTEREITNRLPEPGEIVQVRSRQYLTETVRGPATATDSHVVGLSCIDDDAQGEPLQVMWEKEADAGILKGAGWERLAQRGFDAPTLFAAYLHTLRWNCVTATNPRLFQAPFRAGIKLDAYQIEPLRKALLLPRVNLFIADDVGLGKTIEAGLIARELVLRKKVRDIVVACPPSVLPQWQAELEQRFGLGFEVLDKEFFSRIRRERGFSTNPWTTHSRFLVSHRLLVDEGYTGPMRDWLGSFRPGSLLILDEAHHAAPSTSSRYAIDSKITRAVRDLAPRFEHRLFLSATPHNGHSNSFSALLEILDPQRFCRGVPVKGKKLLDDVMVRRLKEDIREVLEDSFPKRRVVQITIDGLPEESAELKLTGLLDEYRRLREDRLTEESKRTQAAAALLTIGLQQRLLSSVEAFARTLRVHRRTLEKQRAARTASTPPPSPNLFDLAGGGVGSDDERATLEPEALAREEDAHVAAATVAGFQTGPDAAEVRLLDEMTRLAEAACGQPDARVHKLVDWIRERMCPAAAVPGQPRGKDSHWTDTRVIVFTEYEDTLRYLREQLDAAIAGTDRAEQRIGLYRGSTSQADRETLKRAFNADPAKHPLRILLCTDAAREGINLQAHCADLFHFDVPWNPSRMEQRNGRIDRKLQPSAEVRCHYFVYRQRPEDRILAALVRKTEVIKRELGSLAQVIEGKLADTLAKRGIRRTTLDQLEREIESADLDTGSKEVVAEELEAARERQSDLKDQIDGLRTRLGESQRWVGLREEDFRAALSCSLELIGAHPLGGNAAQSPAFVFPAVDRIAGGDASWAETIDALRTPRERGVPFWEWRRKSAIRPVVFADPGTMTDDVVHLHLEHSVVKRLLGRFTAQGFVLDDLSRACFAQTTDSVPRVILLGRLCLYGAEAARLHEEILAVTARWVEPDKRKGPLVPYAREAEGNTLELLEQALSKGIQPSNEVMLRRLQATGPQDVAELFPHLQARGRLIASEAREKLAARGKDEAEAMKSILVAQKKRIAETAAKSAKDTTQLLLAWAEEERRQLEADRLHWGRRLSELDHELATEPDRIRNGYAVKAERVEPVGIAYLWPVTG
jgi:superfamily II DNA or RNA helicase